jgi:hypothetical protein
MSIKERIEKIKEYFKEMQIVTIDGEQVIYVIVNFPYGWVIDEMLETKFDVSVQEGEYPTEFYFATSIDNGENKIFDAIEYNIEKMKDAIERAQLLKTKIAELKDIFQNENITLSELRTLKFTWDKTEDISIQDIMRDNGHIVIVNDSVSISTSSNSQNATTYAEVERQYTSEDNKNNKKNKK